MTNQSVNQDHVLVYPSDGTGCGMYRMLWPAQAVRQLGKPVTVSQRPAQIYVDKDTKKIKGVNIGTAKTVVFQRPGSYQISEIIPIIQANDRKVVIDMDDSLSTIHPRNPAYKTYDPKINHRVNWMHAANACMIADLVTVTTEALAEEYGRHGRVVIIPNHIPKSYLSIPRKENNVPVVGWTGYTATHVYDLRVTRGMINQVLKETESKFVALGDKDIFTELGIKYRPPHEHWGFMSINQYPKKLVGFDIGLVPLQKSEFNTKKSSLKGLEYASLGIVPVVTPIGDYLNLIDMGAALPANSPKEWYNTVKELILNHEMRQELSIKVRKIASEWTIEDNALKWWNAWQQA